MKTTPLYLNNGPDDPSALFLGLMHTVPRSLDEMALAIYQSLRETGMTPNMQILCLAAVAARLRISMERPGSTDAEITDHVVQMLESGVHAGAHVQRALEEQGIEPSTNTLFMGIAPHEDSERAKGSASAAREGFSDQHPN